MDEQFFSKEQACEALGITVRTMSRWLRKGTIKPFSRGSGQFGALRFSRVELEKHGALWPVKTAEPTVEVTPETTAPEPATQPAPEPAPELTDSEQRVADDLQFAERYLRNEATDSAGNYRDGSNSRFLSGQQTLLGPMEPAQPIRVGTADHMNPALLPIPGLAANEGGSPLLRDFVGIEVRRRPQHPNFTRQQLLSAIWNGIRAGYSR